MASVNPWYFLIINNLAYTANDKNTKTAKGDIPNLVKETCSLIIKLSHFLKQFMIQNIVCRQSQVKNMKIEYGKKFTLGLI